MTKSEIAARDQLRAMNLLLEWVSDLTERPVKEVRREIQDRVRERVVCLDEGKLYIRYPKPYWTRSRAEKHLWDCRKQGNLDFGSLRHLVNHPTDEEAHTKDAWVWCCALPRERSQGSTKTNIVNIDDIMQILEENEP